MENIINQKKRTWFNNAILFLVSLIGLVFLFSIIGSVLNWQGTYLRVNTITGNLENNLVVVESLFSREGIRFLIGNVISNFINFTPLIMFIFAIIGIGFAEKTGLFTTLFTVIGKKVKGFWLTFLVVFLSIFSSIIGDIAFVYIIPISAIIFIVNRRNPLVGIIASFAGATGGYGINLFISQMDYSLLNLTEVSARVIDSTYSVSIYGNLFFNIFSAILMTFLITYITENFVVKRVNKYKKEDLIDEVVIGKKEKRGLFLALIASALFVLFFVYMLLPLGTPLSGLLLDYSEKNLYARIFSGNSYVVQGLAFTLTIGLVVCGWLYGYGAKTLKTKNDFSKFLYGSLNNVGGIIILMFLASQLIALFRKTNLGIVFSIWVGDTIRDLSFSSVPLVILLLVLISILNIVQTSAVTKWTIITPTIMPVFMSANITPEFTQAIFKVGDSLTNMVTPFFPYFVLFVGMLQIYNKSDEAIGIKDTYKLLFPYLIGNLIFWLLILVCWYIINLPIGIGVYPII